MAVKGERMSPELRAKMAEGRRLARIRAKEEGIALALKAKQLDDLDDLEDVSLPVTPQVQDEPEPPDAAMLAAVESAERQLKRDPTDPYWIWYTVLEPETRKLFTEPELRELFEEQRLKAAAEKKTRKKKEISELALSTARTDLGLLPEQKLEQMRVAALNKKQVSITVQMPPAQDNGAPADVGLRIDGRVIENGKRHFCTYAEAASIREMLYRHGQHELLFKGQNLRYRAYLLGQALGSVATQINANEGGERS